MNSDRRSFTVVGVGKHGSCKTKFGKKDYGGRYTSKGGPAGAAKKAFSELCRTKRIKGVCTLIVTIRETTKNSNKKMFTYKLKRNKLAVPKIMREGTDKEYVINYEVKSSSMKDSVACPEDKRGQTRGRRLKRTARKTRLSPNNVRRKYKKSKRNKV
jgi:hypothetical protein